jgi:Transglycosylase SLT domain
MTSRIAPLLGLTAVALGLAMVLHLRDSDATARAVHAKVVHPARHTAAVPPEPRGAQARIVLPQVTLPVDSPWALPPMLELQARSGGHAGARLRRQVLHLKRIALSPAAQRSVRNGKVSAGALRLLVAFPRTSGPLLVLALDGRHIRAEETTLWMTRTALRHLPTLPAHLRPQKILLEPVPTDRVDLAGPPPPKPGELRTLVSIYRSAGYQYGIDWRVLAAINRVETNLGQNTHTSSAGAVGWMQFLPSTWRRWGVDASGDGVADPYNPQDAIFSAARYLAAAGGSHDIRRAIFAYNHADWYVNEVLKIAASIPDSYGS